MDQDLPPETTDVLIVGAGAAGLSAAAVASHHGLEVTILDENARPGGQYYRQSRLAGALPARIVGPSQEAGRKLIDKVDFSRTRLFCDVIVWGNEGSDTLLYSMAGRSGRITAKTIILATGAHERVVPFPGWTLPGVMTAGAAQTLLKSQAILPGRRIAIAGTGPFLFPVATQLAAAGGEIAALCEVSHSRLWPLRAPHLWRHLPVFREAVQYLIRMRQLGLSIAHGYTVVEAHGCDSLRAVTVAQMTEDMTEKPGTRREVEVDALLTSFGFVPNTQIARLIGCDLRWDAVQKTRFVRVDAAQATSLPGVFAAGEIVGIGGHRVAKAEGVLAGMEVVGALGVTLRDDWPTARRKAVRAQRAGREFTDHMLRSFALKPGMLNLATADTILCRCESVPRSEIDYHAALWDGSRRAVKQCTRAGMGRCQGRICGFAVEACIERHALAESGPLSPDTAQIPVKPIALVQTGGN
ncbi:2,4-dienoyl-CoA reductase (plasmid) [Antarctobacter heliothermus]|uniref:2,4-dienoyl-CoA reductase n=1 Tax=Antarctobacter heliothermus TaxID=74033 RepID=A0A222EBB9_9RHOB|nr:FAD-dependent oxidoreductase [Antarctobacter heliothermus]ASP23487.1 2,4-dienoyl-CoA reductase [Antarctobacter heliothermus]